LPLGLTFRTNITGRPPLRAGQPELGGLTNNNNFGTATNQAGNTNAFVAGATNQTDLNQTSRPGETNRVFSGTNNIILQDQAFSPADARLLTQIRQAVVGQMRTVGILSPVHYIVRDGVVTMVGVLITAEERQRLETIVQGIPGVVRVIDQIQVGGGTGAGAGVQTTTGEGAQTTTGAGANAGFSNQLGARPGAFGTNFPPTSRTNAPNRIFGTNLPPGLQNRPLPPGLQGQTNFPPAANP
jgi:hypothetical protein